jgi:general L-amino acid transport system substrate-binding protein
MTRSVAVIAALSAFMLPAGAQTMDAVKARGVLICGVNGQLPGFSVSSSRGRWSGFDVDYCRAYAAAIFGDPDKVQYQALIAADRLPALQSGRIDVLVRNTTWALTRETQFGLLATGVTFYDGQGFLVLKNLKTQSARQLAERNICLQQGTTTEENLAEYFGAGRPAAKTVGFAKFDEAVKAYDQGKCEAFTSDASTLYGARLTLTKFDDHVVLSDVISREPLSPYVRQGDDQWFEFIRWTHLAMLEAEARSITQINVDQFLQSRDPSVRRLLGVNVDLGSHLGLTADWAYRVIKRVGNYGEIFDQNLGRLSTLKIPRGLNGLWTDGGLQYTPGFR